MCILSYIPPRTPISKLVEDGLWNGGVSNPDGHGWAIVAGDKMIMGKSLELWVAIDDFKKAREKYPHGPALFHSRWATHGKTTVGNTHPFLVNGSHMTVVAHNGVLPHSAIPFAGDPRSDTRLFADDILMQQYGRLDRLKVFNRLEQWLGSFNKLVILTVDPRYRSNAYIPNQHKGIWDEPTGVWHSNHGYLDALPKWVVGKSTKKPVVSVSSWPLKSAAESAKTFRDSAYGWDDDGWPVAERCLACDMGEVDRSGYCKVCTICQECYDTYDRCSCWTRAAANAK